MKQSLSFLCMVVGMIIFGGVMLFKLDTWEHQLKAEVRQIAVEACEDALLERGKRISSEEDEL